METGQSKQFQIRALREGDEQAVLDVLNRAFQRSLTPQWYDWKHRRGPWGPSSGWVAEAATGQLVAARLFLPWALSNEAETIPIMRAVDGAVAPSAQRQGLFSRCVTAEMDALSEGRRSSALIYSTSVPASREAYRKLGWAITDVAHTARPVRISPFGAARLVWGDALRAGEVPPNAPLGTAWTSESLQWRTAAESGHKYRSVRLHDANEPNGLLLRRTHLKKVPTLLVVYSWGRPATRSALIRAACTRLGAPVVLSVAGPGAHGWQVGASTISSWAPPTHHDARLTEPLHFDFADLEGVM
ncbi:GNAT family N-acetyltransferase [Granulicoccus sp. GXG6511]|uniref:GNAT family N-acetyltransferase n=1 Tax=Granulicoccus sp. GXG6511 TaxID=3381351 RepID=UPI003D7D0297